MVGRVHVTVMGGVCLVGLLDPQRDGLGDQRLALDVAVDGDRVEGELVMPAQAGVADEALRQEDVGAQRAVQF